MSLDKTPHNLAISLNGIGKPEFQLWLPVVKNLIENQSCILLFDPTYRSPEDELILSELSLQAESEILSPAELSLSDFNLEAIIFTNTADRLKIPNAIPEGVTKACFFGGLGQFDLPLQIRKVKELNIDKLISDYLPEEISGLSKDDFVHLLTRSIFISPIIEDNLPSIKDATEEILFIHYSISDSVESFKGKVFRETLQGISHIRVVDLNTITMDKWIEQIAPSHNCKCVVADIQIPSIHHLIANFCEKGGMKFIPISKEGTPSLRRIKFDENINLLKWVKTLAPVSEPSLRQFCNELLNLEITDDNSYTPSNRKSLINFNTEELVKELFTSTFDTKGHPYFHYNYKSDRCNEKYNFYLIDPLHYLCKDADVSRKIWSILYYIKNDQLETLRIETVIEIKKTIFNTIFRLSLASNLPFIVVRNILKFISSIDTDLFFDLFSDFIGANIRSKRGSDLAYMFVVMLQTMKGDKFSQSELLEKFIDSSVEPKITSVISYGRNNLGSLEKFINHSHDKNLLGIAGTTIYRILRRNQSHNENTLYKFKELCEKEISTKCDNASTHNTLALINIFLNNTEGLISGIQDLVNNERYKFGLIKFLKHNELGLTCLAFNMPNESLEYLNLLIEYEAINYYERIVRISSALLLNQPELAELLSSPQSHLDLSEIWLIDDPFLCALHLFVIFKYCNLIKAMENVERWMLISDDSHSSRYEPLLQSISQHPNPSSNLLNEAQKLQSYIPDCIH